MSWRRFFPAAAALAALALAAAPPAQAATTHRVSPLVSVAWLKSHLHAPRQVIVEVYATDSQQEDYAAGHIPGAVFTSVFDDGWLAQAGGARGLLPPPAEVGKLIASLGIGAHTRVILVPGGANKGCFSLAARVFWTLKSEGQQNVSILNGGDAAWLANPKNPVAKGNVTPQAVSFVSHPTRAYEATLAEVKQDLTTHADQLVDARSPAQFEGEAQDMADARLGTLPGARNLPYTAVLSANLEGLRGLAALKAAVKQAGIDAAKPAITFCNVGLFAATDWFLLHELLGDAQVRLYDGSMSQWSAHKELPMVDGKSAF